MMTTLVRLPMLVAVAKSLADAGAAQNERRPDFMDFYLADSITEHRDVAARNPRVVDRVMQLVAAARRDLGDQDTVGAGARFFGPDLPKRGASDATTGVIRSPACELRGKRMSMLVGGGRGDSTYVAPCTAAGKELRRTHGPALPTMIRVLWDVSDFVGRELVIRIVDCKKRGWGHVTFDDFSCEGDFSRK